MSDSSENNLNPEQPGDSPESRLEKKSGSKKKEKEKDKAKDKAKSDERIRAAYIRSLGGILATVLSVILTVGLTLMLTRRGSKEEGSSSETGEPVRIGKHSGLVNKLMRLISLKTLSGGTYRPSGVAAVPDERAVVFVDDSQPDKMFWVPLNDAGDQAGEIQAIPLGMSVQEPRGITQFGTKYYIIGGLSSPATSQGVDLAVLELDVPQRKVRSIYGVTGLRNYLLQSVPELKPSSMAAKDDGLDVGGIALDVDPQSPRILLGLRGPVLDGSALVLRLARIDQEKPWSVENMRLDAHPTVRLALGGQGITEVRFDYHLKAYQVISGPPRNHSRDFYELWEWVPDDSTSSPQQLARLESQMRPGGLTRLKLADRDHILVVGENGSYSLMEYYEK